MYAYVKCFFSFSAGFVAQQIFCLIKAGKTLLDSNNGSVPLSVPLTMRVRVQ